MSILKTIYLQHLNGANANMTLDSSGRVGIGNNSPSFPLHVGGEIFSGRSDSSSEGGQLSLGRASDDFAHYNIDCYGGSTTPSLRFIDAAVGAARMTIDSSGRVAKPYQPSFRAIGAGYNTQYFSSASVGNYVNHNIGSHFSPVASGGTGRFTAPVAGRYYFSASILWYGSAQTGPRTFGLRVNGSTSVNFYGDSASGDNSVISVTAILNLNASDWVDAYASYGAAYFYDNAATTGNYGGSNYNWFCGHLLG